MESYRKSKFSLTIKQIIHVCNPFFQVKLFPPDAVFKYKTRGFGIVLLEIVTEALEFIMHDLE